MAKEKIANVKLQCPGAQATAAPPVGPALGQHGVQPGQFISQFNEKSKEFPGVTHTAELEVFKDRTFVLKRVSPTTAGLLKQAAGIPKGSGTPNTEKVGTVTLAQIQEIIVIKRRFGDLISYTDEAATKLIQGTARSMGLNVKG